MKRLITLVCIMAVSGCATIIGENTQLVPIKSTPSSATITITDEKGTDVFNGKTPTTVTLHKSDGSYWGGKTYNVKITKPGYKTQSIPIKASPNGWYIGGNFIFGGLIGWFAVDPLGGNMYTLSPEAIDASMSNKSAHNNKATDGSITIVLLEDVPIELRKKMIKIN